MNMRDLMKNFKQIKIMLFILVALNGSFVSAKNFERSSGDSSAKTVVEQLLKVRGWDLDWRIDNFESPSVTVMKEFNVGIYIKQVMQPYVLLNRDVQVFVCTKDKIVVVAKGAESGSVIDCESLFNELDFIG